MIWFNFSQTLFFERTWKFSVFQHTFVKHIHFIERFFKNFDSFTKLMGCHPYLILKLLEYDRRAFLFVTFGIWPSVLMHKTHFLYNWVYFWLTRFGFNFPENIFCNVLNSGESSFPGFSLHKFENLAIINETIGILDNNLCFFASRTIGHGCIVF